VRSFSEVSRAEALAARKGDPRDLPQDRTKKKIKEIKIKRDLKELVSTFGGPDVDATPSKCEESLKL
jgi:hypothetical protein